MTGIEGASSQSIKPFRSSQEYLVAMKEDLAEWLRELHDVPVWGHSFLEALETGTLLCHHANEVTRAAHRFLREHGVTIALRVPLPVRGVTFSSTAPRASFAARDNVSNFITWCRKEMGIADVLMFETDDLVLRKNEKNFVLCLLEVARRASRFGMVAPTLIQMEEEIEQEIHEDLHMVPAETLVPKVQRWVSDFKNLDEMVLHLVSRCTCPTQFPMVKVSEGKYRVGDSSTVIFVRILRSHVMVRVGGGWDTLEHYLDKHDPCRCTSISHKSSRTLGLQRPTTPVHGVMARPGPNGAQPTLLVSRMQSPPPPVCWSPSAALQAARPGSVRAPLRRSSPSPDPNGRARRELRPQTPSRMRERAVTPSGRKTPSDSGEDSMQSVSMRTGREATRQRASPHLASSLAQLSKSPSTSQPEAQHPGTPVIFQRHPVQPPLHVQHSLDAQLGQKWKNSASRLKQSNELNTVTGARSPCPASIQKQGGPSSARPSTPVCSYIPIQNIHHSSSTATKSVQPTESARSSLPSPHFIRTFSPTKHTRHEALDTQQVNALKFGKINPKDHLVNQKAQWRSAPCNSQESPKNMSKEMKKDALSCSTQFAWSSPVKHENSTNSQMFCQSVSDPSHSHTGLQNFKQLHNKNKDEGKRTENRRYVFTPQPLSPAQEASLYRSLEHEILTNLQLLDTDSDDSSSDEDPQDGSREEGVRAVGRSVPFPQSLNISFPSSKYPAQAGASVSSVSAETGYGAVIDEFLKRKFVLKNVDTESWVAKLPSKSGDSIQTQDAEINIGHIKGAKQSNASSLSSLASSARSDDVPNSKEAKNGGCGNEAVLSRLQVLAAPAPSAAAVQGSTTQRNPSFKQIRSLKKPERVPSIYKLKLRPRIRPRRDHRPEKKPSKIPTPVSYRRIQPGQNSQKERRQQTSVPPSPCFEDLDSQAEEEPLQQSFMTMVNKVTRATEETERDQEEETWV